MSNVVLPEGWRAKFQHERNYERLILDEKADVQIVVNPRGGITKAFVYDPKGNVAALGHAICRETDNYNKKIGRAIALGRAMKSLR